MAVAAVEKLAPSVLSDQTELLADDLDIETLELVVKGAAPLNIRPLLTGGDVDRTIEGASTVTLPLNDYDRRVLRSGYLAKNCDVSIDGLWFRLKAVDKTGDTVTATFEDREVALLRDYPRPDAAHNGFKVWDATKFSRAEVARQLVQEVREVNIRLVCPALGAPVPAAPGARAHARTHGFGPGAQVSSQNLPATAEQKKNLDLTLQTGVSLGARRKVLLASVMVTTQESNNRTSATNGVHVGLYQQDPRYWPATRDPVTDATAFFQQIITLDGANPNLTPANLAEKVQKSGLPELYAQWETEANATLTAWGVAGGDTAASTASAGAVVLPIKGHQFVRGTKQTVNGKAVFTRESNWEMLVRLATEVGWRCFCVSGTIYFIADQDLLASQPRMTLSESSDGVDSIDGAFDEGRKPKRSAFVIKPAYAKMTVSCRIGRWQAPPGSVVEVVEMGPFDGRWLVADVQRPLFANAGLITLHKPQPTLPEALSPELRNTTGATVFNPSIPSTGGSIDGAAIVAAAQRALATRVDYRYLQVRPMPDSLFSKPFPKFIDCSAFATLCYKAGGAPDPNGFGYNGRGNTQSLVANGTWVTLPQPGDLCFYGTDKTFPHHVTVFIGNGRCISMGGAGDPKELAVDQMGQPFLGFMTYIQTDTPSDRHHH